MKTSLLKLGLVGIILGALTATAKPAASSPASSSSSSGSSHFAMGFASYGGGSVVGGGAALGIPGFAPSISALWDLNSQHSLQFFTGIQSSSPFAFGVGAMYRFTIAGDPNLGLHIGGGFSLGSMAALAATAFYMDILPVVGFHFSLGGSLSRIRMMFSGGPMLHITPSPFQFMMGPSSGTLLGFAVHYTL